MLALCLQGCGPIDLDVSDSAGTSGGAGMVVDGRTMVVVVVNPVVNTLHAAGVPGELGEERDEIAVAVEAGGAAVAAGGLAVVEVPVGSLQLQVGPAVLGLAVKAEGDVIDAPIGFNGDAAAFFSNTPIRHAVGAEGSTRFAVGAMVEKIAAALNKEQAVVVLEAGVYRGDLVVRGEGVLLFGEGWAEHGVVIDGSLTVEGDDVRVRGVTITGSLRARGKKFGMSFSRVLGASEVEDGAGTFLRNIFCGEVSLEKSGGIMLDNFGLEPITQAPAGACSL
jgi:hypothetical protein